MDIERLKELAEKATPGPWEVETDGKPELSNCTNMVRGECPFDGPLVAYGNLSLNDAEFIAAANPKAALELIAEVERLRGFMVRADAASKAAERLLHDYRLEIERLKKALDQAIDCAGLSVETVVKDKSYGMWRYEGETVIVGQSSTENFFAGFIDDNPELAAYLKERDGE